MHRKFRLLTILIAIIFTAALLTGCGIVQGVAQTIRDIVSEQSQPETPVSPTLPPAPGAGTYSEDEEFIRRTVAFEDMTYERPDTQAIVTRIHEISELVGSCDSFEEVDMLTNEVTDLYDHYSSMLILAIVHSTMDKSSEYWLEEELYTMRDSADMQVAMEELYQALYRSPYKADIEAEWDENYFEGFEDMVFMDEETKELSAQLSELSTSFNERLTTDTVQYGEQELTYTDINNMSDYDEYKAAQIAWYDKYVQEYGELYIETVRLRQKIAQKMGYDNYIDYYFDSKPYDATMVSKLLEDVVQYAVPVHNEMLAKGYMYRPDVNMEYDDFLNFFRDVSYNLSPSFTESLDFMQAYNLCDFETRPLKERGAYTTYIYDYDAPFMVGSYDGSLSSISTFVHEFGHFNDYYYSQGDYSSSLDTMEIFSQAMELLFSNYLDASFSAMEAYQMRYDMLVETYSTIPQQAYYTAFEMRVYSMDPNDLTVEALSEISSEEMARLGLDAYSFDEHNRYSWATVSHLFDTAFYTISYVTSADIALQIWQISLTDEYAAVDAYFSLMENGATLDFIENVEQAGLANPFAEGRMEKLAAFAQQYLIDEDWASSGDSLAA